MAYGGPTGDSFTQAAGGSPAGGAGLVYRNDIAGTAQTSNTLAEGGKLWLPIWSGEVIHAYDEYNKFEGMVDTRTISSGASMEFPITGTVGLKTAWGAGEELIGGEDSRANTFAIHLDKRPMAAHFELDNIDLMFTQWEYRAELARQAGMTLANARDKQIAAYIARAAAEDDLATVGGVNPKDPFESTTYANLGDAGGDTDETDAALLLLKHIEDWMVYLQENNIPTEGVYAAVTPAAFQSIRALGVARDYLDLGYGNVVDTGETNQTWAVNGPTAQMFGGSYDGLGSSLANRPNLQEMMTYMGCTICKTNHGPFSNYVATADNIGEGRYNLKFTGTPTTANEGGACKAIMWQRGCVAALSLQGLKVDTVDDVRRNTVFTVASKLAGTGVLRPELAVAVLDSTVSGSGSASDTRTKLRGAWGMAPEYVTSG
jgi:hypothetical protein